MARENPFGFQRRVLYASTGATLLGAVLMLTSICTDYWVMLEIPRGHWRNESQAFVVRHHSGLWQICRHEVDNVDNPIVKNEICQSVTLFATQDELNKDPEVDNVILDYNRTETAFAVISLVIMVLGHIFAIYSFHEPRYMFKRLAAVLHLMTAITILVSAEVLINSVNYELEYLPARHPEDSYFNYGYSFALCWVAFALFLIAAIAFAVCSRKRKGDLAENELEALENEPVHLGRL